MPADSSKSSKLTLSRLALYAVAAIAAFLVLRFVFSVAMSVLKFVAIGVLVVFVVWVFLSKDGGAGKSG